VLIAGKEAYDKENYHEYVQQIQSQNSSFEKVAKLMLDDPLTGSRDGFDVDVSGDCVIAGNVDASCAAGDSCGAVYIYDKPVSGKYCC